MTPAPDAMAAGIETKLWDMADLVEYIDSREPAPKKRRHATARGDGNPQGLFAKLEHDAGRERKTEQDRQARGEGTIQVRFRGLGNVHGRPLRIGRARIREA